MTVEKQNEKVSGQKSPFNLDGILSELGSFGKYQLVLLLLLSFRDSFLAMCNFHYVFTAAEVGYRCAVPECELYIDTSPHNESWHSFALSNETKQCIRPTPLANVSSFHHVLGQQWNDSNSNLLGERCRATMFSTEDTVKCEDIIYDDYNTIVAEFDLGCEPWKRTFIGTAHNLGLIVSSVLSGLISDRYGRKVIIVATPLLVGLLGLMKSFSANYWMLVVLEFFESALGYGNASMVLSLETVNQNNRVVYSCVADMLSNIGSAFFGLIAWKIPYWRHLIRAIYAPLLVAIFYIFLVDEGVRWLLAHNKIDEAVKVLHKVAKMNKVTLSSEAKDMLTNISEERGKLSVSGDSAKHEPTSTLLIDLRSRTIILRLTLMSVCFICCSFVYNGAIMNAASISGNKYINYSALMLVSIPVRILTAFTLTRFGRKTPICVAYGLCAVFFVASAFVPKSIGWASVMLFVAGKMGSSYGFFALMVVAMEVFPTTSRNSLVNVASTIGRLGSVIGSQTPLLTKYMVGLQSIVFGLAALVPCLLALLLPDTSRVALPDDVAAAEKIEKVQQTEEHGAA